MKCYYPAIFRPKGEPLKGYDLNVSDVPGCLTTGDDINECMEMVQDALGLMLEGVAQENYPAPSNLLDIDISEYPAGSFVSYVCFDKETYDEKVKQNEREAIERANNPIKELLNRRHMKIIELAEFLGAPYRTVQDWSRGITRPPGWVLNLILDKILD